MSITLNMSDAGHVLVLVLIAALVGVVVELVRGGSIPLGFVGELLAAGIGAWIGSDLVAARLSLLTDPAYEGVALVPAVAGALIIGLLWGFLGGRGRQRERYY
jgi:uncharacterized membrane protein YeaQ/YmgE (transglycosylase-associated protein family)